MTTTTAVGQSVLDQLSKTSGTSVTTNPSSALGKDAFLQLLVTQLKNQDPLTPQDNTAFVSQLAQFSNLEATQNLNTSVGSIATTYQSSQALQASSLVGRSVVVATGTAVVDTTKGMTGSVAVPASSSTVVKINDASGNLVDTIDLGIQPAGTTSFTWDGKASDGTVAPAGTYSVVATGTAGGTATALTTYLPATVNSVTMGLAGAEMTLNLAGGSSVGLSKVQTIGI
ncbi:MULTISPECIES: flagellar hook assembly protein FlgD [unclassified Pseudomonas]|uniref:flagellar hook assembly protein FlgD n=1 Tax=unclassified Pseudomonas TaxID=196821 RepID=UPI002AC9BE11|nr:MULTISPECIES: flagellar hook assembly protein FlgD [unclassified Pseudomonas]MEB0041393.1 flagellar hook assembly protein FlgD [Pseudomonas sp. MH10]MEB0078669.1 flagellar hook assembly protein FlgD [Pseudomonas sp. MH10out]MEB0093945.1 flagellar hook assembly protein FlgD [Pseudomonas sp. CCI4.2]MEB0103733.1 flagellar hook assembly protein FlgD [Pseudomonas sp. CCI3.2]MEB0121192.1 flagellar hook assembly protein FlgD [Pseudomonas sp. CCI1.2]